MVVEQRQRQSTEIIVAIVIAIFGVVFFIEVEQIWKIIAFISAIVIGLLNFITVIGGHHKIKYWRENRSRRLAIRSHPDFMIELKRLTGRIKRVLYTRESQYPSLAMIGPEVMNKLAETADSPRAFADILTVMTRGYTDIDNRIIHRMSNNTRNWETEEFVELMRSISFHLGSVNSMLNLVLRVARNRSNTTPLPNDAVRLWEQFRAEYNTVFNEWIAFSNRFDTAIGWGTTTEGRPAEPLATE